jgi:hypothetical protein
VFLAVVLGLVSIAWAPFLFGPLAALVVLIGSRLSDDARLTSVAATTISVCFVIGAALAVINSSPLY